MTQNKNMPEEKEAEMATLGCVFLEPKNSIILLQDMLVVDDFYYPQNRLIFRAMLDLQAEGKSIDATTVTSNLTVKNKLEQAGGPDYILELATREYTVVNLETYVELIKDASLRRKAINTLADLSQAGYDLNVTAENYIDYVEQQVFELAKSRRVDSFYHVATVTQELLEQTERNAKKNTEITGLDTGFNALNKLTQGFQKGQLIILAARPAMGKSAMALNLAFNVSKMNNNAKVAIFSLEMPKIQLLERMVSADAHIKLGNIKTGKLDDSEWVRFNNSLNKLNSMNLYFDDNSSLTISDIRAKCRKLKADTGLDMILIDYLQLISSSSESRNESQNEKITKISRNLKLMARELEVPVIALSQLSRKVEDREDKTPAMADLRDSGAIEQDADIVMFIYREEYYLKSKSERKGEADLIIGKNRSGGIGTVVFNFMGEYQRFKEIIKEEEK